MKRKYKKTKKGHMRRNATIKRKKHTRRQHGGAYTTNIEQPDGNFVRNGQEYNVIEVDYDDSGLPKYMFIGKARAIITHQTCGVGADAHTAAESMCPPNISYEVVNGILAFYNPDRTIRSTYTGDFVRGKMHGHGKHTFHTHLVFQEYEGDFENGEMHGTGKMVMKNRDVYDGNFQHDNMHGKGIMTFHDGSRYEGDWDQGQMHGVGDVYDQTGNFLYKAIFENNEPVDEMEEEMEEGEAPQQQTHENTRPAFFDPQ